MVLWPVAPRTLVFKATGFPATDPRYPPAPHQHEKLPHPLRCCTRRDRPRGCSQQLPPSNGDCHTPLPCEVRKGNDTTPPACRLYVQGAGGCCRRSLEAIARREKPIVNQPVERA